MLLTVYPHELKRYDLSFPALTRELAEAALASGRQPPVCSVNGRNRSLRLEIDFLSGDYAMVTTVVERHLVTK